MNMTTARGFFLGASSLAAGVVRAAEAPAETGGVIAQRPAREATDLLERFVNWLHGFFPGIDEILFHWVACAILFAAAILLRHIITNIIFHYLKKLASRTETTLDDKLFPALERPTATLVMIGGIYAALTVLQLSPHVDQWVVAGARVSSLAVVLWGLIRAGGALLDHAEEIAIERKMTVATFMPLIKKTLFVFAVVFSVLVIAQSQGLPVQSFLAGLGIGGLAFALAAQDTIANLFGSFVVVVDQPFKVGDAVRIGGNVGTVEDIGLRSTRIRLLDKSLLVVPNKSVATEAIANLSRFTRRRFEQVVGLTYDTKPGQMEEMVQEIRRIVTSQPEVDAAGAQVFFRDFSASSLDIWMVFEVTEPDYPKALACKQRVNLEIMRAVEKRGLSFAFPTQTLHIASLPPAAGASTA